MIKVVLVLLYILNGEVVLEQKPMPSMEVCYEKGQEYLSKLITDPKFDSGLYADCIPLIVTEAKNEK